MKTRTSLLMAMALTLVITGCVHWPGIDTGKHHWNPTTAPTPPAPHPLPAMTPAIPTKGTMKEQNQTAPTEQPQQECRTNIVVMDRGWVYVGKVTPSGDMVTIENARNIRRWGTSEGLGELAEKGPLPDTKLDNYGTVVAPMRAVIHFIKCKRDW